MFRAPRRGKGHYGRAPDVAACHDQHLPLRSREPSELPVETVTESDIAADLMRRLGVAIDEWARVHRLQTLPKDLVLRQIASVLKAMTHESNLRKPTQPERPE
jgi:hypothetical protein